MNESSQKSLSLSAAERVDAGIYLADLAGSSLPLLPGLRAVAEELSNSRSTRRLAATFREMADRLEAGQPLEEIVEDVTSNLPTGLRGIIQAGVKSGQLGESLSWFVGRQQLARRQRRQIISVIGYPLVLLIVLFAVLTLVFTYVVPAHSGLMDDFGVELPVPTQTLFWFSRFGFPLAVGGMLVLVAIVAVVALVGGRSAIFRFLHRVPWLGRVFLYNGLADFSGALGLLIRHNVPLPEALQLTSESVHDAAIRSAAASLASAVGGGRSFTSSLQDRGRMLAGLVPVVRWGEQYGAVGESLRFAEETYAGWAERQAGFLKTVIPPFTFLFVLWCVVFLISGLLLPLVKLIQALS